MASSQGEMLHPFLLGRLGLPGPLTLDPLGHFEKGHWNFTGVKAWLRFSPTLSTKGTTEWGEEGGGDFQRVGSGYLPLQS